MRGLWDELRETTLALHAGQQDAAAGRAKLQEATVRLADLRKRNMNVNGIVTGRYTDEIHEIESAMTELRAEVEARAATVRIFHRPGRNVTVAVPGMREARGRLPDIQVVRIGQVDFIELDGRLRVRDWWELRIDGRSLSPPCEGPKRWIMKNAAGAAAMDVFGKPPAHMLWTGLAKRRGLYKRRRDKRREADKRRRVRIARKAFRRAQAKDQHGVVVFAGVAGYIPIGGDNRERYLAPSIRIEEVDPIRVALVDSLGRG